MKIAYYAETDSMYIDPSSKESVESTKISPGVVVGYDSDGDITGIDIDNAGRRLDLKELVLSKVPVFSHTIVA